MAATSGVSFARAQDTSVAGSWLRESANDSEHGAVITCTCARRLLFAHWAGALFAGSRVLARNIFVAPRARQCRWERERAGATCEPIESSSAMVRAL